MRKCICFIILAVMAVGVEACSQYLADTALKKVQSPIDDRIAMVTNQLVDGKQQSELTISDGAKEIALLHYLSLDYGVIDLSWSPDGKWIAFVPSNAAFADDSGVWVFSADGQESHQANFQLVNGWTSDSQYVSLQLKDYCCCLHLTDWQRYPCPVVGTVDSCSIVDRTK